MIESAETSKNKSLIQDRLEWYGVCQILKKISLAGSKLELRLEDIIHIGGTAMFYRCLETFGDKAVVHYRGTRDMDLISFRQGSIEQAIEVVIGQPDSPISNYKVVNSFGFQNKRTFNLTLGKLIGMAVSREFKVDVYESSFNTIRFNAHRMTEDKLVLDPPESISFHPRQKGLVAVPSWRDAFVIKMDIVDGSKSGLREKDKLDILTTLAIHERKGQNLAPLLEAVTSTCSPARAIEKIDRLASLFANPLADLNLPPDYPFLPSKKALQEAIKDLNRAKDRVYQTPILTNNLFTQRKS